MNELMTKVFVEQPLALPGSAKKKQNAKQEGIPTRFSFCELPGTVDGMWLLKL